MSRFVINFMISRRIGITATYHPSNDVIINAVIIVVDLCIYYR